MKFLLGLFTFLSFQASANTLQLKARVPEEYKILTRIHQSRIEVSLISNASERSLPLQPRVHVTEVQGFHLITISQQ